MRLCRRAGGVAADRVPRWATVEIVWVVSDLDGSSSNEMRPMSVDT
jgi:hypothetical protein